MIHGLKRIDGRVFFFGFFGFFLSLILTTAPGAFAGASAESLLQQASAQEEAGNLREAEDLYRRAQDRAIESGNRALAADILLLNIDCKRAMGEKMAARRSLGQLLLWFRDREETCARGLVRVARDYREEGDSGAAREVLNRLSILYPEEAVAEREASALEVRLKLDEGLVEEALADARALLALTDMEASLMAELKKLEGEARVDVAARQLWDGNTRQAGIAELEAVSSDGDYTLTSRAMAGFRLSCAHYWERDYPASIAAADAALLLSRPEGEDPGPWAWSSLQAAVSAIALGDPEKAADAIVSCNRDYRDFEDAGFREALQHRREEIIAARRAQLPVPGYAPDPNADLSGSIRELSGAAIASVYAGDATGAITALQQIVSDPAYADQKNALALVRYHLAEAHYQNRDYASAIAVAERMLEDYPPNENMIMHGHAEIILAAALLAAGEPRVALERLERCEVICAPLEDGTFRSGLNTRLHEARNAVRRSEREKRLAAVRSRKLPREQRRQALIEYADLSGSEGDPLAQIRAHVMLRQEFGGDPTTASRADAFLDAALGTGNVPNQAAILREAIAATDSPEEILHLYEEMAYRQFVAGYFDECIQTCEEAISALGDSAEISYRLLVTLANAYRERNLLPEAFSTYCDVIRLPFLHSEPGQALVEKTVSIADRAFGKEAAIEFLNSLMLSPDDPWLIAWKTWALLGQDNPGVLVLAPGYRLETVETNSERLPLYWAILLCQLWDHDFSSVEATISEMRETFAGDALVDGLLLRIVGNNLNELGEVLCRNIFENSGSIAARQVAAMELNWIMNRRKDEEARIQWLEAACEFTDLPDIDPSIAFRVHIELGRVLAERGPEYLPLSDQHILRSLEIARTAYPKGLAEATWQVGIHKYRFGSPDEAIPYLEETVQKANWETQSRIRTTSRIVIGRILLDREDTIGARKMFQEAFDGAMRIEEVREAEEWLERISQ